MPNIYTVPTSLWGDMILFADSNRVFTVCKDGSMEQIDTGEGITSFVPERYPEGANNDGRKSSCVEIALQKLSVSNVAIRKFKVKHGEDASVPTELCEKILKSAGYIESPMRGKVGLVVAVAIRQPDVKFFFISVANDGQHAFAVVDGVAHNVKYGTLTDQVLRVWAAKK